MIIRIWEKILYGSKKSTSSFTFSLSYFFFLQRHFELVLGTLGMLGYAHQNWYYQFVESFRVYLQAKSQLHPPCFPEDWLSAFWPITWEPEFFQIWDWWWNISNNISFHFRLFRRKTNDKIFQKFLKKLFGEQFGSFLLKFGQKCFLWKRELCLFLNIPITFTAT